MSATHIPVPRTVPAFLKPGDKVALLSPSSPLPAKVVLEGVKILGAWGYVPVIGANALESHLDCYAGTVEERWEDLRWALSDPEIKAVVCNRGGYGSLHLVDGLDLGDFSSHPKWLVGFSDISTLHAMETRAGVMSVHGPMCSTMAPHGPDAPSALTLRDVLEGRIPAYMVPADPCNIEGRAEGLLVGGNMATFFPLLGGKADPTASGEDLVLFMEEVEESFHHIDRMFRVIESSGVLERTRGVILGEFTGCRRDIGYDRVEQMLRPYLLPYGIPLCCGMPSGHDSDNYPLVMGSRTSLDVGPEGARIEFEVEGSSRFDLKVG